MKWTETLLNWYFENKRDFLWRQTKDPYKIWLSEIILQQTKTSQGLPYYKKFIKEYPTINDLALSSELKVLKLWQGLGYYSRARNLHSTAKYIVKKYDGKFPNSHQEILNLKGVGDYTASAIASICFGLPHAVVDGNVYRFLSRYFGITTPVDISDGFKEFKEKATSLIDKSQPGDFNQALIEFGALQCKPRKPNCNICPFIQDCFALNYDKINILPVKRKVKKIKNRHLNYLVMIDKNERVIFEKRQGVGIWQNMYQFPLLETNQKIKNINEFNTQMISSKPELDRKKEKWILWNKTSIIHKLSHQKLHIFFWINQTTEILPNALTLEDLKKLPVPVVIQNFIDNFFIT